jgi:hypothetical protein
MASKRWKGLLGMPMALRIRFDDAFSKEMLAKLNLPNCWYLDEHFSR